MRIIYTLPKPNYFSQGRRGRVSHALGVIEGFSQNGVLCDVVSGSNIIEAIDEIGHRNMIAPHEIVAIGRNKVSRNVKWMLRFLRKLKELSNTSEHEITIIRYSISQFLVTVLVNMWFCKTIRVIEVNSLLFHHLDRLPECIRRLILMWECFLLRDWDFIYVVSDQLCLNLEVRIPNEKIIVIPNGATPRRGILLPRVEKTPTFVYMGVLQKYYNFDMLLKAFVLYWENGGTAQFHIYGDGPQLRWLKQQAGLLESVFCHGRYDFSITKSVSKHDVVFLLPYRKTASTAIHSLIKLFEYMAMGRPIVAPCVGQILSVLSDGETPLLYEPGDITGLAYCLRRLDQDKALRIKLGQNVLKSSIVTILGNPECKISCVKLKFVAVVGY